MPNIKKLSELFILKNLEILKFISFSHNIYINLHEFIIKIMETICFFSTIGQIYKNELVKKNILMRHCC